MKDADYDSIGKVSRQESHDGFRSVRFVFRPAARQPGGALNAAHVAELILFF